MAAENTKISPVDGLATGKLVHLALPVRWSLVGQEGRVSIETACTYDIHPRGARLLGGRNVSVGDMVMVERGRNKALCQVIWTAEPDSLLRGQFTVQCVEAKTPWDDELRQLEEQYQPVLVGGTNAAKSVVSSSARPENRRRRPRYAVDGKADVIDGVQFLEGQVEQLSECGALISAKNLLLPGTDFRLMINVFDVNLALKAQVKYQANQMGMGVEFHEIRRGDRPLLEYVLSKLRSTRGKGVEELRSVEVREPLAVAG